LKGFSGGRVGVFEDEGFAVVAGLRDPGVEGEASQEGDAHFVGHFFAAAALEDMGDFLAMGADEAAHVFDDAQYFQV